MSRNLKRPRLTGRSFLCGEGIDKLVKIWPPATLSAIYSRSVRTFTKAFHVLLCHPWPCTLLNLRF